MSKLNGRRVVLAGLAAGLVMNVIDFVVTCRSSGSDGTTPPGRWASMWKK